MKVFRELLIHGDPGKLTAVAEDIYQSVADGWTRDVDAETNLRRVSLSGRKVYCFACTNLPQRPAATVFLLNKDQNSLYVTNIVPHKKHELTAEEYNAIIEEFAQRFVRPAAKRAGVTVTLSEKVADLETWLPGAAAEKLRFFSAIANRRTGSSHPMDRDRWFDFIVAAHEAEADFTGSTLAKWLHEEGGWDEQLADRLACEYEFARRLLAFSQGETVGR